MSHGEVGYQRPPVKNQFRKGQSGNPRGRWKGQRNLPAVLTEILRQPVTVKQGDKSERLPKGEALIKMLMSKALNGDRKAIAAMLTIADKIGRVQNAELKSGFRRYGFMLVPGMAASTEEWEREIAARPKTPPFWAPAAVPRDERYAVRRPLARRDTSNSKSEELTEASISENAAHSQTLPFGDAPAAVPTAAGSPCVGRSSAETSDPKSEELTEASII